MKVLRDIGGAGYTEINYRGDSSDTRSRVICGTEEFGDSTLNFFKFQLYPLNAQFLDAPSTSSATTYKVQIMVQHASYAFVNRTGSDGDSPNIPRGASSITLMEIQQ